MLNNSDTLGDMLMVFDIHVYQVKTVCGVPEWLFFPAGFLSYIP